MDGLGVGHGWATGGPWNPGFVHCLYRSKLFPDFVCNAMGVSNDPLRNVIKSNGKAKIKGLL